MPPLQRLVQRLGFDPRLINQRGRLQLHRAPRAQRFRDRHRNRRHLARGKQDADETSAIPGDTIADRLAAHMKSEMAKRAHVVRHAGIKAG